MIYNATFPVAMVVAIILIKSIKQNFKAKLKKTIVYDV